MRPRPKQTSSRLAEAFAYAEQLHRGQTRKKTLAPILSHLMAVASLVLENGGDEEEAIAALLHDGPEDSGGQTTLDAIRDRFGDRVADIVDGCTDNLEAPESAWRERKQRYITRLGTASPSIFLVSLADKLHNVNSLVLEYRKVGEALWERFTATREDTLWYYGTLLEIFRRQAPEGCSSLLVELNRSFAELEKLTAGHG